MYFMDLFEFNLSISYLLKIEVKKVAKILYVLKYTRFKIKTPKVSVSSSDNNVSFKTF